MKTIFSKIWLVWGALYFISTWVPVWLAYQIANLFAKGDRIYPAAFNISRIWSKCVLFFLGIRLKTHGAAKKHADQQVVYVCNHRSQIDIPINFATNPQFVILSKAEALKIPVVATNLKLGHVTVNRKDKANRKQSILRLKEHLRAGRSLLLYPEGRRTREDVALGEFHDGAFSLAREFGLPIVPITIVGSDKVNNPKQPLALLPGVVQVYFDNAIQTTGNITIDELKEYSKQAMLKHLI